MIQVIRDYEATSGRRHPIGMTPMWPNGTDSDLYASGADWISITGSTDNPAVATGAKVVIADTDHICGICGNVAWVWRSFTRGQNPILMAIGTIRLRDSTPRVFARMSDQQKKLSRI